MTTAPAFSKIDSRDHQNSSCLVEFCGLRFRFEGLELAHVDTVQSRFGFTSDEIDGDDPVLIKVHFHPFVSKPVDAFTGPNGYEPLLSHSRTGVFVEGENFQGKIHLGPYIGAEMTCCDPARFTAATVFENFLRIVSSYAILCKEGLFMHSAAVLVNGLAYIFIGRSNAGKTTISRMALAAGHSVLSDDANIIYSDSNKQYVADAVPFAGELGQTGPRKGGPYPVAGIYWLTQGSENQVGPLGNADKISRLMVCSPVLNVDALRMDELFSRLTDISARIPVASLKFSRLTSFNEILPKIKKFEGSSL